VPQRDATPRGLLTKRAIADAVISNFTD